MTPFQQRTFAFATIGALLGASLLLAHRGRDTWKGRTVRAAIVVVNTTDDDAIRREAEQQIANTRALDGCNLRVTCYKGVLRVSGIVQSELQVDAARNVLRGIEGVRS